MSNAVRVTCARVQRRSRHVAISQEGVRAFVGRFDRDRLESICARKKIDTSAGIHYIGDDSTMAQYLLVLDAINFCFWPDPELQYHHLSTGLQKSLTADSNAFNAERLKSVEGSDVRRWLNWPRALPLEDERARLLREVGQGLNAFEGHAEKLILAANRSAMQLVSLVTCHFPGFRDHAVYHGEQVFLHKRAQIFVGDVWGSFGGKCLGQFHDIDHLTTFPDYVVPRYLQHLDILRYSNELQQQITEGQEVEAGTAKEIEIRAGTVMAVEQIREAFREVYGDTLTPSAVQLDWWLWETASEQEINLPHHCTWTMFY